ncbi:MAG: hypothetical protein HC888_03285 [Candidatus Competibacteraceae bacterium]|nr:hypothetical protein [Candidatus Competibacteraceae bacterium]
MRVNQAKTQQKDEVKQQYDKFIHQNWIDVLLGWSVDAARLIFAIIIGFVVVMDILAAALLIIVSLIGFVKDGNVSGFFEVLFGLGIFLGIIFLAIAWLAPIAALLQIERNTRALRK